MNRYHTIKNPNRMRGCKRIGPGRRSKVHAGLPYPKNPVDVFPFTFLASYDPTAELAQERSMILITDAFLAE